MEDQHIVNKNVTGFCDSSKVAERNQLLKSLVHVVATLKLTCDLRPRQLCKKLFHKQAHAVSERAWLEPHYGAFPVAMALSSNELEVANDECQGISLGCLEDLFSCFATHKFPLEM